MATIYYKIFKHHKKKDGRYNIKYCLTHRGKQVYYASTHHVQQSQLKKDMAIKDGAVLSDVLKDIAVIERRLSGIGVASDGMDAKQLLAAVTKQSAAVSIDFIAFSRGYLEELKVGGREGTAASKAPA